ncbi:MAG: roadblock/LC7 domain-containing protein [Gemmatimonadetes bacterium]|nr:roadblock/LC7 domain-containing protein [Gemmatimonadota bacterium]
MSTMRAVEGWTVKPLERFVNEAGARLTLLMTPAGQVLAQFGFTRAVDVMAAAALGAAIVSSTAEIARLLEEPQFSALNHQGLRHGIFVAGFDSPRGRLLALVVYGTNSSVGLVQLFFEDFVRDLIAACPVPEERRPVLAEDFERELNQSLASLFRS